MSADIEYKSYNADKLDYNNRLKEAFIWQIQTVTIYPQ